MSDEQVFSESQGSPRLPSASFARVDQEKDLDQDLPPALEHGLTEDHNGEPVCECGWDPALVAGPPDSRANARAAVLEHIKDQENDCGSPGCRCHRRNSPAMTERAQVVVAMVEAQVLELERFAKELEELHPAGRDALRAMVARWLETTK